MMSPSSIVFDSNIEVSSYLINGQTYPAYIFDFGSFTDNQEEIILLDTPGLWKGIVTLVSNDYNVQGVATFNVGTGNYFEQETEIGLDQVLLNIASQLRLKLNLNSGLYLRVVDAADINSNILDYTNYGGEGSFAENCILFAVDSEEDTQELYILTDISTGTVTKLNLHLSSVEINTLKVGLLTDGTRNLTIDEIINRTQLAAAMALKQDKLVAGSGIVITNGHVISSTGAISMLKVDELPEVGQTNIVYLVPKEHPGTSDIYNEYIWVLQDEAYELLGTLDLTGYATEAWVESKGYATAASVEQNYVRKLTNPNSVYGVNGSGQQGHVYFSSDYLQKQNQLVLRDGYADVLVPDSPTSDNAATSKKWVLGRGYATELWVTGKGYITGINSTMIADALGYTPVSPSDIASVYKFKGSKTVAEINALQTSGLVDGWVYNVTDSGTLTLGSVVVVAGDNVAWNATSSVWDKLAGTIDLSGYVPYSGATGDVDLNGKDISNIDWLGADYATIDELTVFDAKVVFGNGYGYIDGNLTVTGNFTDGTYTVTIQQLSSTVDAKIDINVAVPSGTTPTDLSTLKQGNNYYKVPNPLPNVTNANRALVSTGVNTYEWREITAVGLTTLYKHDITIKTTWDNQDAYLTFSFYDDSDTAYDKATLAAKYNGITFTATGNIMGSNTVDPSSHRTGLMRFVVGGGTSGDSWSGVNSSNVTWTFWPATTFDVSSVVRVGAVQVSTEWDNINNKPSLVNSVNGATGSVSLGDSTGVRFLSSDGGSANTDGGLKIVVTSTEPATKRAGFIYFITES